MDERERDMNQSKTITGVQDSIGMATDTENRHEILGNTVLF